MALPGHRQATGGAHKATLEDVAREAGVSRATVSRVVTGVGRVSGATRLRVEAAIAAVGYRRTCTPARWRVGPAAWWAR